MFRSQFLWKLYVGYGFLILLTTGIVGGLVGLQVSRQARSHIDDRLEAEVMLVADLAVHSISTQGETELQPRIKALGERIGTRFTVIAADGRVLADSHESPGLMDNHGTRPEVLETQEKVIGTATRYSKTLGKRMRYLALPLETESGPVGWARASLPLTSVVERLGQFRNTVLLGATVAALVALGLGFLFARRVTLPVLQMAVAAESIAAGNYEKQVEISSRDELGSLARAFNVMTQNLRTSIATINADRGKLTAILGSMVEGVVAADLDQRVMHMNAASGRMLEVDPERALGQPIWEAVRVREVSEAISEALRRGQLVHRVVRLPGSPDRILDMHAAPLDSGSGAQAGVVLVLDDVTQLRRLETMRSDFLGNVSHELKTPVTAIRALIETVLDDAQMPESTRHRFLRKVRSQTERLSSLVSDLLSLSRFESETDALEIESIDLRNPVRASIRALATSSATKGIELRPNLSSEAARVLGDAEALQQAVGNLINNAIKYSQGKAVDIRVETSGEEILVEIEDDGVGIEQRHLERIFERFYRVDKARSRELGGTGLGLAIVKHIALAHSGRVSVDSTPGVGSVFQLRLPKSPGLGVEPKTLGSNTAVTTIS